jgi:hypothetical protein
MDFSSDSGRQNRGKSEGGVIFGLARHLVAEIEKFAIADNCAVSTYNYRNNWR